MLETILAFFFNSMYFCRFLGNTNRETTLKWSYCDIIGMSEDSFQ